MLALTQAVSDRAGAPISVFRSPAASSFRKHPSCPAAINIHPHGKPGCPLAALSEESQSDNTGSLLAQIG